jgi:hypothetical protein
MSCRSVAFATDDVLLYGLIARHRSRRELIVVGDLLSYDPFRRTPAGERLSLPMSPQLEESFRVLGLGE